MADTTTAIQGQGKSLPLNSRSKVLLDKLTDGLEAMEVLVSEFRDLTTDKVAKASEEYYDLTEKSDALTKELAEEERAARVQLAIDLKENAIRTMEKIATENGLSTIRTEDLAQLRRDLSTAQSSNEAAITAAVEEAKAAAEVATSNEIERMKLRHQADQATNLATIQSLEVRLTAANASNTRLESMLTTAQANHVKIAEAGGSPVINVEKQGK